MPTLVATNLNKDDFEKAKNYTKKVTTVEEVDVAPLYVTEDPMFSWNTLQKYLNGEFLLALILLVLAFAACYLMFDELALPGGVVFSMGLLWILATVLGARAGQIGLPPLVGMLLAGFLMKNVGLFGGDLTTTVTIKLLKDIALVIIMLRAGFGLDLGKLAANAVLMGVLSWIPAFIEATTIMLLSGAVFGFPVKWGFLLGFLVADVSPAVTVPLLLDFQVQGYGTDKGIPTILLAGSGFNSVFAIIAFGVTLSFIFATGEPVWVTIARGLGQVFLGVAEGVVIGEFLVKVGWRHSKSEVTRFTLVLLISCVLLFGMGHAEVGMKGGGTLGVVVIGIYVNEKLQAGSRPVQNLLNYVWSKVGQPYLFGLLGTAVLLSDLKPSYVSGGCVLVFSGLLLRAAATFVCTLTTDWNFKEKMFTCITWCPKATVQAALATVALDYINDKDNEEDFDKIDGVEYGGKLSFKTCEKYATIVQTVAVLSIILTAPFFAVAMKYTGETWLVKSNVAVSGDPATSPEDYDPDEDITFEVNLGKRKDTLSSALGDRKISIGGDGRGFRVPTITTSEKTPAGVKPRINGSVPVYNNHNGAAFFAGGGNGFSGDATRRRSNTAPMRTSFTGDVGPVKEVELESRVNRTGSDVV